MPGLGKVEGLTGAEAEGLLGGCAELVVGELEGKEQESDAAEENQQSHEGAQQVTAVSQAGLRGGKGGGATCRDAFASGYRERDS